MSKASPTHGRCLCAGIRYVVRGKLRDVIDCHCERCRRFTGHHMAATSARLRDITIEDADSLLRWFWPAPEVGYAFCARCGSSLFWQCVDDATRWTICAGTLDTPTGLKTTQAWWISEAGDYYSRPDLPENATE